MRSGRFSENGGEELRITFVQITQSQLSLLRRRRQDGVCRDLERWTPRFAAYLGALYLPAVEALVVCGYR